MTTSTLGHDPRTAEVRPAPARSLGTRDAHGVGASAAGTGRSALGRPFLFSVMLAIAAAMALGLLIVGPTLSVPVAVGSASVVMVLVLAAWIVAGPKL
ncbi:hypothetical protein ACXET9_01775 [Brachybacterium sp. DNPG3]